jgi:hypothetical protein
MALKGPVRGTTVAGSSQHSALDLQWAKFLPAIVADSTGRSQVGAGLIRSSLVPMRSLHRNAIASPNLLAFATTFRHEGR